MKTALIADTKYARNHDKLRAWDRASHSERAPKRVKKPEPPAGGAAPSPSPQP